MSLIGTLGKVAVGVMVAKGAGQMLSGGNSNKSALGSILGSLGGNNNQGGLGDLLGKMTGQQQEKGGLSDLLGALGGNNNDQGGGLSDLLGKLGGAQEEEKGGLGGLLSGLGGKEEPEEKHRGGLGGVIGGLAGAAGLGAVLNQLGGAQGGGLGDLFNSALQGEEPEEVTVEQEQDARLFLRAMINAAKADGKLDEQEQRFITNQLDGANPEEIEFVRGEITAPMDLDGLIADVPKGKEQQVYFMSLLGITLDTQEEAQYMDQLAKGLNLSEQVVNHIHQQAGVQELYS